MLTRNENSLLFSHHIRHSSVVCAYYLIHDTCKARKADTIYRFELIVTNRLILNLRDTGRSDKVPVESRTELAFKTAQTTTIPNIGADSILGNLGEYMHVYGDDNEDALSSNYYCDSEKAHDCDGTTLQLSESPSTHESQITVTMEQVFEETIE